MKQFILFILFSSSLLFSCRKEKASWSTDWNVPIINDTLDLSELIRDSLIVSNNGISTFHVTENLYNESVSNLIDIPDTTVSSKIAINVNSFTVGPGASLFHQFDVVLDIDDVQLNRFKIKTGILKYKARSVIPTYTTFNVDFPFSDKSGMSLKAAPVSAPATASNPTEVEGQLQLDGYSFDTRGEFMDTVNSIFSKLQITTDPNGPSVVITKYDTLYFEVTLENVVLEAAEGYFGQMIHSTTTSTSSDLFSIIRSGSFDFPSSEVALQLKNGVKAPTSIRINSLKSINASGNELFLNYSGLNQWIDLPAAQINGEQLVDGLSEVFLNESNSSITNFIEHQGKVFVMDYDVQLNQGSPFAENEFVAKSSLKIDLKLALPLDLGLSQLVLSDTSSFDFSSTQFKNLESMNFQVAVQNSFPIGALGSIRLLSESNELIHLFDENISIASSQFGSLQNGLMVKNSQFSIPVSTDLITRLPEVKKVVYSIVLDTQNPSSQAIVSVPANAFLGVKITGKLKVKNAI